MTKFLDEVLNFVKPNKPQVLQELIEPENHVPNDEEANNTVQSDKKKESLQEIVNA